MKSGIYRITNTTNGKVYIGSTVDFAMRWSLHRSELNKGTHPNIYLRRAWAKYGADAFIFEIVEEVEPDALLEREQFYLDQLFEAGNHYNVLPAAYSHLGAKRTLESRARLSAAAKTKKASLEALNTFRPNLKGRKLSDETRARMSEALRKRWANPEQREKLTKAVTGRKIPPEAVARSAAKRRGYKHTEEAKAQMSKTRKGRKMSDEQRANISAALKGRTLTEEHKAKIGATNKAKASKINE
jgi:group I intron endonuclease